MFQLPEPVADCVSAIEQRGSVIRCHKHELVGIHHDDVRCVASLARCGHRVAAPSAARTRVIQRGHRHISCHKRGDDLTRDVTLTLIEVEIPEDIYAGGVSANRDDRSRMRAARSQQHRTGFEMPTRISPFAQARGIEAVRLRERSLQIGTVVAHGHPIAANVGTRGVGSFEPRHECRVVGTKRFSRQRITVDAPCLQRSTHQRPHRFVYYKATGQSARQLVAADLWKR